VEAPCTAATVSKRWGDHPLCSNRDAGVPGRKRNPKPEERPLVQEFSENACAKACACKRPHVIYGNGALWKYNGSLTGKDLGFDSLYNTCEHAGLPPGPLESGEASLVLRCGLRSRTIFICGQHAGGHFFSPTLAEHNKNVVKYRRLWRTAGGSSATAATPPSLKRSTKAARGAADERRSRRKSC